MHKWLMIITNVYVHLSCCMNCSPPPTPHGEKWPIHICIHHSFIHDRNRILVWVHDIKQRIQWDCGDVVSAASPLSGSLYVFCFFLKPFSNMTSVGAESPALSSPHLFIFLPPCALLSVCFSPCIYDPSFNQSLTPLRSTEGWQINPFLFHAARCVRNHTSHAHMHNYTVCESTKTHFGCTVLVDWSNQMGLMFCWNHQ